MKGKKIISMQRRKEIGTVERSRKIFKEVFLSRKVEIFSRKNGSLQQYFTDLKDLPYHNSLINVLAFFKNSTCVIKGMKLKIPFDAYMVNMSGFIRVNLDVFKINQSVTVILK